MGRRGATTAERAAEAERERRARAHRERERRRLEGRPAAASSHAAVRERHEGLVGWLARSIRAIPTRAGGILRGFGIEVVAVVAGSARWLLRVLPGSHRLLDARRIVRAQARGLELPPARARTQLKPLPRVRPQRTEAEQRARDRRRAALRRRLRLVGVLTLVVAMLLAWIYVPGSDAFRIRHVEVTGSSAVGDLEARTRIDELLRGETIYTVDEDKIVESLQGLPFVRAARVERHLPGGLELRISEYRPLALGYGDGHFWLVAQDGRILARASRREWTDRIPLVALRADDLRPGVRVADEPALRLLAARESGSTLALARVEVEEYRLVGWLKGEAEVEIRFGRAELLAQKVAVAELMLGEARRKGLDLVYVDVTVPSRPAICARQDAGCLLPRESRDKRDKDDDASGTGSGSPDAASASGSGSSDAEE